jgi:NAD(P)-dependent dehydrogenase (short-subunit alcohol dehydrogenase family)
METLKDKVAFVTGGASGIGLGISKAMVAAGMRVVLADVREDHLRTRAPGSSRRSRAGASSA